MPHAEMSFRSKERTVMTRRALFVYVLLTGMIAVEDNGSYVYRFTAAQIGGRWDWRATSPVGGILTLNYATPTVTQTFQNQMYLSIGWVNTNTITVFGDMFYRR
jgi:hypothetical protein